MNGRIYKFLSEANAADKNSNECDMLFGFRSDAKKLPKKRINLNGVYVNVLVDSGSSLNIVSESDLEKMKVLPKI